MALARYESVAVNLAGDVIPNATVEVRRDQPGRPVVPLFSDREGTIALGNPITTDEEGKFAFHVPGGVYYIRVFTGPSQQPLQQYVRRYQAIGTAAERDVEDLASSLEAGTATFPTLAELEAFVPTVAGVGGKVTTGADAGYYHYDDVGEEWVFDRYLYDTLARMNVTGGTDDAIEAEIVPGVPDASVVMLWIEAPGTNTGPVTINGTPVLNSNEDELSAGQWVAGRTYWFSDETTHYKLRTDSDVSDLVAQAEAAAAAAIAAQAAAEAAAAGAGVTDGDKGGIVVSSAGTNWQIKDGDKGDVDVSGSGSVWAVDLGAGAIDLVSFGLSGDGVTDESVLFQTAVDAAWSTGVNKLVGRAGYAFKIKDIVFEHDIEIDLRGGKLLGYQSGGVGTNGSQRMMTTDETDNVSVIIRNGDIDGGYLTIGSSGYGDRSIFFSGGDRVEFHNLTFHGMSNRLANAAPPLDAYDFAEYKSGEVVVYNAKKFVMVDTKWRSMAGEMLLVMSNDARTVVQMTRNEFSKKRDSDGAVISNTPVNIFNVAPSMTIRDTIIKDTIKSAMNLQTNGGCVDGFHIENVADSSGIDWCEAASYPFWPLDIRNGKLKNVAQTAGAGIRASAKAITIHNVDIEIPTGRTGIRIDAATVGGSFDGSAGFPAGSSSIIFPSVRISQIVASGAGAAVIDLNGVSSSVQIHADIDTVLYRGSGGKSDYAVDASHSVVTVRGGMDEGDLGVVRLTDSGHLFADKWIADPDADLVVLTNMPTGTEVYLKDSERIGSLAGGSFDVNRGGTTAVGFVTIFLEGKVGANLAAPTLDSTMSLIRHSAGAGTPEGAIIASIGSTWARTDGGAGTSLYVKESGHSNTGWVAK